MLSVQDCEKRAGDLERAAERLHIRSHREAYLAVAAEWRQLADAARAGVSEDEATRTEHLAQLRAKAGQALDSPLRRSIQELISGWTELTSSPT